MVRGVKETGVHKKYLFTALFIIGVFAAFSVGKASVATGVFHSLQDIETYAGSGLSVDANSDGVIDSAQYAAQSQALADGASGKSYANMKGEWESYASLIPRERHKILDTPQSLGGSSTMSSANNWYDVSLPATYTADNPKFAILRVELHTDTRGTPIGCPAIDVDFKASASDTNPRVTAGLENNKFGGDTYVYGTAKSQYTVPLTINAGLPFFQVRYSLPKGGQINGNGCSYNLYLEGYIYEN